jgi:hypothetical protein
MNTRHKKNAARPMAHMAEQPFHQWVSPDGELWAQFFRLGEAYLIRFPEMGDFEVSACGLETQSWPAPGSDSDTIEHLFLNQVLPLALSRQLKLVLHGSAVNIGGQGVAFLGESGMGKSTLAASFAIGGSRFLTDDGLLLSWENNKCHILPSHASIRLWEDSEQALIGECVDRAPALKFTSKARLLAGESIPFCNEPKELKRVYFLGDDENENITISPITPSETIVGLIKNSFLLDCEARDLLTHHFDEICKLAELPIYYRIDYPRNYGALSKVKAEIEKNLHSA